MLPWIVLSAVLLSPYVLAIGARHVALRHGADGVASGWFTFVQRIQWTVLAYLGCWPAAYAGFGSPLVAPWLARHGLSGWAAIVDIACMGGPIIVFQVLAAVVIHGANRSMRGAEVSGQEVVGENLASLTGIGFMLLALCAAYGAVVLGRWRVAIAAFLVGILGGVVLSSRSGARRRFAPHSVTHGELRDRLFAMAARAGVRVRQLYVVRLARTRIAQAVAARGESVMVSDYLLAHLSRDELDAVFAHELAHHKHRHPTLLALALIIGGMAVWSVFAASGSPIAGLITFFGVIFGFLALSRRIEYQADAGALALGARPEALITALARIGRINHMPQRWSRLREWTVTHPSNQRRARRIAVRGGVPVEHVDSMLEATSEPSDRYELPPQVNEDRVFTTMFKVGVLQRNAWAMLFANAVASAAFATLVGYLVPLGWPKPLGFVAVGILAFAATFGLVQYLAMRPYRELRSSLLRRHRGSGFEPEEGTTRWVGLAPYAEPRLYEGFATWDVGFLALESSRLVYLGEEASFSLAREEVLAVELGPRFPAWVPVYGVAVRWRRSGEPEACFTLLPIQASGLISYAAEARALRNLVERWRAGDAQEDATTAARPHRMPIPVAAPPTGHVTGSAPHDMINPAALVLTIFLQVLTSTGIAVLMALPFAPMNRLGVGDAVLASVVAYLLLILPLLRARHAARRAVDPEARRAA